jgi:hypothetical protein
MEYFKDSPDFHSDEERYDAFFGMMNLEKYKEKLVEKVAFESKDKPDFRIPDNSIMNKYKLKAHSKISDEENRSRINSKS